MYIKNTDAHLRCALLQLESKTVGYTSSLQYGCTALLCIVYYLYFEINYNPLHIKNDPGRSSKDARGVYGAKIV